LQTSTFNAAKIYALVVEVYLKLFRRSSFLKCVLQPKIAKQSLKSPILGVKVVQSCRCW